MWNWNDAKQSVGGGGMMVHTDSFGGLAMKGGRVLDLDGLQAK